MKPQAWPRLGVALLLCVALAACGSGDSDDDDDNPPNPPTNPEQPKPEPVLRCAP
ncbi:hypothetical protein [Bordetella petrii]|uniref:hypothetical protein n=1 Tax=Bordetella petrii TaxID=94624 RepID=UPI001E530B85|nr:hypothetical protein [Bordetella petrii]MCD0504682.1 hypothetical protein [Bordetella petrii]